jgi:teichuronic acid exporter
LSLKKKAYAGLFWSLFQLFGIQGLNFILSIIMARILMPEDYGILGMLAIFMAVGNTLINSGLTASLIRSVQPNDEDYSTVFWLNLIISGFIYLLLFFTAPLIAEFFNQPILISVVRVYCLSFIFGGLSLVQRTRLTKKMDFKTQMKVSIPSLLIAGGLGIFLAFQNWGVWALVYMNLIQIFLNSVFFWVQSGWKPLFIFKKEIIKNHLGFGYKLTFANLLESLFRNSYQVLIGKYFPVAQLGFYAKADSLKQLPVQNISSAIDSVTFPLFANIQNEDERLKYAYRVVMQQILFWLAPVLTFAGILAVPIFEFLLTEKWVPAAPFFQILCVIGIMYPLHSYNINILKVKGRSDLILGLEIVKKIPLIIGLYIAISQNIFFLLYLQVGLNIFYYLLNSSYSGKMIGYSIKDQLKDLFPIFIPILLSGLGVYLLLKTFSSWPNFLLISGGFIIGFGLYLSFSWLIKLEPLLFLKKEFVKK